jgi:hypothetical protein
MHFERKTIHIELRERVPQLLGRIVSLVYLASSTDCGPHLFVMPLRERPMLFCPARGEDLCRPQSYSQILRSTNRQRGPDLGERWLLGWWRRRQKIAWPISTRVNKPENDDPSIMEPIELTTDAA